MVYFKQINPLGCLLWTVLFVWLFVKLKLYYVVAFLILFALAYNFYKQTKVKIKEHQEEQERNYEPEMGEVYKVCSCCGNSVKRSAKICPHCKNSLDE
ncbi:MAG: hypothetical protein K6C94_04045 [Candidatus Gastranaerophilales bacterium]|nr:hypothetical protein [Candidatus Gastranaerophilales bacterium]